MVGPFAEHVIRLQQLSATDLDAQSHELVLAPRDVVEHLRPRRLAAGETPLSAQLGGRLDEHDIVPALGAHARCLETPRPTTYDDQSGRLGSGDESVAAPLP